MTALTALVLWVTASSCVVGGNVPAATIRSSYIRISDHTAEIQASRRADDEIRDPPGSFDSNRPPKRSYIIYDDMRNIPSSVGQNQQGNTRAWHLQFNRQLQRQQPITNPSINNYGYHSVYSNMIQIVDDPQQRKYFGPYDGKAFFDGGRRFPIILKPVEVPKYDVVYPFESKRDNIYYNAKLPEKFPTPFYPNRNFQFKDPPPIDNPRQDTGFYRTHTVNYPNRDEDTQKRDMSERPCNYIRVNDKGFPTGNELCGRSISDIILEDNYPTTGDLVLEHRKRYRGAYPSRSLQKKPIDNKEPLERLRIKRSPEYMSTSLNRGYSCCGDFGSSGYSGYQPYGTDEYGYGSVRFVSRPYQGYRGSGSYSGYGYRNQGGQSSDDDDIVEETSNNRGLASYLTNGGRGGDMRQDEDSRENDSPESSNNRNGNNRNNLSREGNSNRNENDRNNVDGQMGSKNSNQSSSNNPSVRNPNSRGSSRNDNKNRGSNGGSRNLNRRQQQQSQDNYDNEDDDRDDSGYSNRDNYGSYSNGRNGGNNYDYMRIYNRNRGGSNGYGSNGYGSSRYGSNGYGSNGYGSNGYGSSGYGSSSYGSNGYGSNGYGSNGYGSSGYGSNSYGSNGYGSNRYGTRSYGGYGSNGYSSGRGYGGGSYGQNSDYGGGMDGRNSGYSGGMYGGSSGYSGGMYGRNSGYSTGMYG